MREQYVLPNQCQKCGTTFDLWYELIESEERLSSEEIQENLGKKLAESLCWGCKKQVLNAMRKKKISSSKKNENEVSEEALDEFFLDLEY